MTPARFAPEPRWLMRSLALLLLTAAVATAADWPQWLGPNRDGEWRETGLVEKFPTGGPVAKWRTKVGQGYSGPAVANGRVFLTDRLVEKNEPTPSGAFDTKTVVRGVERMRCFDAANGEQKWEHSYPAAYRISYSAGPRCTPTVDGDRVYTLGAMGDLLCLSAADGAVRWKKNFMSDFGANVPVWGFSSHPLVDGDLLICLVGGTDGRLVMAFDKLTGAEKWRSLSFESGDFGYGNPVIYTFGGRRQLVIWHPKAVVGLDPTSGSKIWEVPFDVRFALTAPTPRQIGNDGLFLTSFYNGSIRLKVTADSASVVWKSTAKGERPNQTTDLSSIMPTPFVVGDHIYGVCSYGELRCLTTDGKRVWSTMKATRGPLTPAKVAEKEEPSVTQPWAERWSNAFLTKNGDRFVLFNEQGELILAKLTPAGYEEIDRAQILKPTNKLAGRPVVWTHPAFADQQVFARNDEELVCVSLAK